MNKLRFQNILILICFFLMVAGLRAQQPHLSLFQSRVSDNPVIAGEGITRHLIMGDNLMKQGNFENAILSYDNAVAQNPYFAEAYIKRGIAKYQLGRLSEAQQDYAFATRINPYAGDLYGYGNNLRKLKVLAFEPYQLAGRLSLERRMEYYEGLLGPVFGAEPGADASIRVRSLSALIGQFPASPAYYLQRAVAYLRLGEHRRTVDDLNTTIAIEPENALAHDLLGLAYLEAEYFELAEKAFERAIELDPGLAIASYNLGLIRQQQLRYQEAMALFSRSIELDAGLEMAYFNRALVHKAMGNVEAAMKDYSHLLGQEGQDEAKVWLNRGIARKMSGDITGALADIEQAMRLAAEDNAVLYKLRGNIFLLLGNYLAAEADYTRSIELEQGFAEAYYNRGIARILAYNRPDACLDFRESAELGYDRGEEQIQYLCSY
ncbi:MAG: tetratricopeptide repeat protein [Lewinellaceae bacterium]|nr:tetratricopeptide repeat protein [Phaeodactylibacter sp.]MCB9036205.1 tetratricopeptide repeat protein [Lewinellaceae bacterium]